MKSKNSGTRKWIIVAAFAGAAAGIVYLFPLFRVVKIETAKQKAEQGRFNAKDVVAKQWNELNSGDFVGATDANALLKAIRTSPAEARTQFSRRLGIGNTYYYFLKGEGRVVAVKPDSVAISLSKSDTPDIVLMTAKIYGNTVRDGLGVFKVDDYPSSQEFNQLSVELNKRVESDVLPTLREKAKTGATVFFVGCVEITDENSDLKPLKIVPVAVR